VGTFFARQALTSYYTSFYAAAQAVKFAIDGGTGNEIH